MNGAAVVRNLRMTLRRLWRLGDIELPIGKPWFVLYWPTLVRTAPWPVCWQGWATFVGGIVWFIGSIALFVGAGWAPGNLFFYAWFMPSIAIWIGVIGAKTEARVRGQD